MSKLSYGFYLLVVLAFTNQRCQENQETDFKPPLVDLPEVKLMLSSADGVAKFAEKANAIKAYNESAAYTINIDDQTVFQEMDGFGFTLTGGSALLIHQMSANARNQLLKELFSTEGLSIGISYLRISIGASDLDSYVYSYNDLASGTDEEQSKFSLEEGRKHLIPVLKEILAINPQIKIMASPWSPPTWMKSNGSSKGGSLKLAYYDSYALYLMKYIQEMAQEGIVIEALTIQNEPLNPNNNPSMYMTSQEQGSFIKQSLGPLFKSNEITTKMILYDHNADHVEYAIDILNDEVANPYINGTAFHLYGGKIDDLAQVHTAHPDKDLYFTEQWIGSPGNFENDLKWHIRELFIGATRNWCKNVLEWNLAADPNQRPYTDGGCSKCLGGITIDGENVIRNPGYYIVAHASKFVRPGSVRILSNAIGNLPNVAFLTPDDHLVLIALNNTYSDIEFNITFRNLKVSSRLTGGAVATYVF